MTEGVFLAHAETTDDLSAISKQSFSKGGHLRAFSRSGGEDMTPLHHLRQLTFRYACPLKPLGGIDCVDTQWADKKKAYTKIGDVLSVQVGVGCVGKAAVVLMEDEVGVADD